MAVKNLWLFVSVVLTLASVSYALKCLKCNDCEHEPTTSSNCLPGFSVCMKTNVGGKIRKMCAPKTVCKLEDVDRTSINPLKNLKTIFSDHDIKKLVSDKIHAKDKIVNCCEEDFCNGAPKGMSNMGLFLVLPGVLYLFGY